MSEDRRKFTCPRCNIFVEAVVYENGDAVCPHCENSVHVDKPHALLARAEKAENNLAACMEHHEFVLARATKAESLVERLIEAGNRIFLTPQGASVSDVLNWQALGTEWKAGKK